MTTRRTGLALALVGLVGAVLALYYWVHKPVTPAQALAIGQSIANLATALALVLLGGGLGRRVLYHWLGAESAESSIWAGEGAVVEAALGWGLLGLGMLLLGLLRLYYPGVAWLLAGLLLVVLRRDVGAWCAAIAKAVRALAPTGRLARVAAAFSGLMLALGLLRALAPPVMWDALVYHLTLPQVYAHAHGLQVSLADFSLFSGMPQLTEMLYTAAGLLRVDVLQAGITAQALGWCFGALLCLGLAVSAQEMSLPPWLAPAILLSAVSVTLELAWAYTDLLLMLLAWATVLALRQWRRNPASPRLAERWLVVAGILAGLACGCKYTGIIVPLGGGAVVLVHALFDKPGAWPTRVSRAMRPVGVFMLLAAIVFGPWLLKNWLLTGSPIYPLLWPAADMDTLRQWFYNRPDLAESIPLAATIFVRATFFGVQGGNNYDVTLGPLLLLLPLMSVLVWRWLDLELRQELRLLALFVIVAYIPWVLLSQLSSLAHQARLFFAVLPCLALLGAAGMAGLSGLDTTALRLSVVVNAAFALVLGLTAVEVVADFASQNPLAYLAGVQTATDYTTSQLGWYQPALERVNALPPGSRVMFLWEARSLACIGPIVCVPDVIIDRWWHQRRTTGTAEQILDQWRAQGITNVLIYDTGAAFVKASANNAYDAADWTELAKLRDRLRALATFGDAYTLYALP